jgi:hypothetical protein
MKETLQVQKLAEYFKKNLGKGYTPDSLRWALINQGYQRTSVEKALELANFELARQAPLLREKPVIKHEIIDETGKPVEIKKPWWKRIFGL